MYTKKDSFFLLEVAMVNLVFFFMLLQLVNLTVSCYHYLNLL